ncbi:mechanosensitive ion channel domain-containing protein [Methanohalophilus sp.]|uniref:mechanosensitive ion channel domain-containing protein n=1 Tax=Methanohalophilus sp. TaxID=1966352 RepID=UPI0026033DD8|nr:mechanosensitive ion channel domain-containing protein [Methanohalophilus sp.]MDK2892103.1 hypothetical protein [Methanohalophilus sp.]
MQIELFYSSITIFLITIVLILLLQYFFRKIPIFKIDPLIRNTLLVIVSFIGLMLLIFTLPISGESKQVIVSAIGIVVGATVALSSTTFVSNGMSGIMLRIAQPFSIGDYIRSGDVFGRVSRKNLLYTEVQSIDRDIITIPNLKLMSNPLTTILSSGTIISTTVSLGYENSHDIIEKALLDAAKKAGLENPFVHILELGDFSVTYKVGGLLKDVSSLLTDKSNFNKAVIDSLHESKIEIVSPAFMNQRVFPDNHLFIPRVVKKADIHTAEEDYMIKKSPEDVIFDLANEAEVIEKAQDAISDFEDQIKELEKNMSTLPADVASEKKQVLESIKNKEVDLQRVLDAIQKTSAPEHLNKPEGIIRLKVLEHLNSLVDTINSDFAALSEDVEKLSCNREEDEFSEKSRNESKSL